MRTATVFLLLAASVTAQTPSVRQTGLLFDDVFLRHLAGNTEHPERPERLIAIRDGLEKAGLLKSLYRIGAYPGTGSAQETGRGAGSGKILNVPMSPGSGDAQFLQAFETKLVPAARKFKPDFILVSAGFDSMRNDLLGQFDITPQGYTAMTKVVMKLADEFSHGRVVSVLEGGYRLDGLAESVVAHVKALQSQ